MALIKAVIVLPPPQCRVYTLLPLSYLLFTHSHLTP